MKVNGQVQGKGVPPVRWSQIYLASEVRSLKMPIGFFELPMSWLPLCVCSSPTLRLPWGVERDENSRVFFYS